MESFHSMAWPPSSSALEPLPGQVEFQKKGWPGRSVVGCWLPRLRHVLLRRLLLLLLLVKPLHHWCLFAAKHILHIVRRRFGQRGVTRPGRRRLLLLGGGQLALRLVPFSLLQGVVALRLVLCIGGGGKRLEGEGRLHHGRVEPFNQGGRLERALLGLKALFGEDLLLGRRAAGRFVVVHVILERLRRVEAGRTGLDVLLEEGGEVVLQRVRAVVDLLLAAGRRRAGGGCPRRVGGLHLGHFFLDLELGTLEPVKVKVFLVEGSESIRVSVYFQDLPYPQYRLWRL